MDNLNIFKESNILHDLKHYLPAQAPLKDFVHHNTLHAFQKNKFFDAVLKASEMFGYKASLPLHEYRTLFQKGTISEEQLKKVLLRKKGEDQLESWTEKMVHEPYEHTPPPRIGTLRSNWKKSYRIDLDSLVHPTLFRLLCSFLDQGIAMWPFPITNHSFLDALRMMEKQSMGSFFRTSRAKSLFLSSHCTIENLLHILVGDERFFKQYIFDQQFAHQGWSGMVSSIEDLPEGLLDQRKISLHDVIIFELLLEIDALEDHFGEKWNSLAFSLTEKPLDLFAPVMLHEKNEVMQLWQEAMEWTYYDDVLKGMLQHGFRGDELNRNSFQAMFCIDDRECSVRRYVEMMDPACKTFGTPGFFSVEFFFQPQNGKFYTKLCPAPVTPKYLIKEVGNKTAHEKDVLYHKGSQSLFRGWLITNTLGLWSAIRLFINVFKPSMSPATASSFNHMDKEAKLTIEYDEGIPSENGLQIGFTIQEMVTRVEALLRSIGLVRNFADIVYVIGHGSSSINNPHFAAYDCGACCGRPGSVNARVFSFMANHPKVRAILKERGIEIPETTQFIGGLHDTCRDEVDFYDEPIPTDVLYEAHIKNVQSIEEALALNAKERSRRFVNIDTQATTETIHKNIMKRSVSLFEPRPELNHATNTLCIVGRRGITKDLFLDRRAFMNSYDYRLDPEGTLLFNILRPAAPVCGGINLEYYFSRVDNKKLGAGTKLPHNVMGLVGVANGIEGDLRPGLPSQMIEIHDPIRLLIIVEHFPDVVLKSIQQSAETYEWFINEWVNLVAIDPEKRTFHQFVDGSFIAYNPSSVETPTFPDTSSLAETSSENIQVHIISKSA